MALSTRPTLLTDTWVKATWEVFTTTVADPQYEQGRGYFDNGYMRVEIAPLGAGHSRLNAYEWLGVAEYWVVNVAERRVIAFAVEGNRSGEVAVSGVLPGLEIALVEEALRRSETEDDTALMRWLMETLQ